NVLVAIHFRPVERDRAFLLPPDMTQWLGAGHVVWFLLDVVAELDLTQFYERAALRRDGRPARNSAGRAAYDPAMLLALLIYGYACGQRSSRQIERLCHTDIAFRLICAEDVPDHTVLARFRKQHAEAFAGLFTQVLRLCRAVGLATLCTVAIDGSTIPANASRQANRGAPWLATEAEKMDHQTTGQPTTGQPTTGQPTTDQRSAEREAGERDRAVVEQMLSEAQEADAAEDATYGAARGDELPPQWHGRAGRRERIRAAQARIAGRRAGRPRIRGSRGSTGRRTRRCSAGRG
ncbi:MAG: transposase, partial [Pseudonocardiaceae bacterium]